MADSDSVSSRDRHLRLRWRKTLAVETHWWEKQRRVQHPAKAVTLHNLTIYVKKLVFKYRKSNRPGKNQLWVSEDFLHKTCFHPVCDHMLWVRCISSAKSAWRWHLTAGGILHLRDVHQKNGVTFLPILIHIVFAQNRSLLAIWMGRGKTRGDAWASLGRTEVSVWNYKGQNWRLEALLRTLSYCLNNSKVRYSECGSTQLYPCNPAFQRCWLSAAPTGPNWASICSALLRLVPLEVLTRRLMKQMKTENHTIFKGND